MGKNEKTPIVIDGTEYLFEDMTDEQKMLVNHCADLDRKIGASQFNLDQLRVNRDNDWTATNDMMVTSLGAFVCRVNGSVEVQQGDLLQSNGDGTARVQAHDIIRSSTIGKVTSTVKTHEFDDGSYCVPTVLYCG